MQELEGITVLPELMGEARGLESDLTLFTGLAELKLGLGLWSRLQEVSIEDLERAHGFLVVDDAGTRMLSSHHRRLQAALAAVLLSLLCVTIKYLLAVCPRGWYLCGTGRYLRPSSTLKLIGDYVSFA